MKKAHTYLMLVTFIFLAASCSKDATVEKTFASPTTMSPADHLVMNRLIDFRRKMAIRKANPQYKSDESVLIGDARWDVETNFNTSHAFPDASYFRFFSDSAILYLPVINDSSTLMDNVLIFYNQCFDHVLDMYNDCPYTGKELLFVSLKPGSIKSGMIRMTLKVTIGEKATSAFYFEPFVEGDDWMYGYNLGKCDGSYYLESDAAKQLKSLLNTNRPIYQVSPPFRIVYAIDPESPFLLEGNEYTNENGQNLIFYLEKAVEFTLDDYCLEKDEMNFHYNGEETVVYERMPLTHNKPSNWDFLYGDIQGFYETYSTQQGNMIYRIRHINWLTYGYRYIVFIGEIGEPVSLADL